MSRTKTVIRVSVLLSTLLFFSHVTAFTPLSISVNVSCVSQGWILNMPTHTQTSLTWNPNTSQFILNVNGITHTVTGRSCALYYLPLTSYLHMKILCSGKFVMDQSSTDQTVITADLPSSMFTLNTNGVIHQFPSTCQILTVAW